MTTRDYLSGPEDLRRRELVWGVVREPPAPFVPHQRITTRVTALLDAHVREHDLGTVLVSPTDVVLDEARALVVQPDVLFVSHARAAIIGDVIRGAPDLVVEVASPGSARYDRITKLTWYAKYGVREYWLIDPGYQEVIVHCLEVHNGAGVRASHGQQMVRSSVLPRFPHTAAELLEPA